MLGAQRTDGEAPKPPQISLETSLNHGHPVCTLAPSVTQGLKHPSCGAGRVLIRSASPERRPPSVPTTQAPQLRRREGPHPLREPRASPAERPCLSAPVRAATVEASTAVEPASRVEPASTVEPFTTAEPFTTVEPADIRTVEPSTATYAGIVTIEGRARSAPSQPGPDSPTMAPMRSEPRPSGVRPPTPR